MQHDKQTIKSKAPPSMALKVLAPAVVGLIAGVLSVFVTKNFF
jgi:hypothetical protein